MTDAHWTVVPDGPKPHVHPLRTPGGRVVTSPDNPDHPWQRALWFVVKYLDDGDGPVNFWEEFALDGERGWGHQRTVTVGSDDDPGWEVEWVGPDDEVWVRETRTLTTASSAPGTATLDWTSTIVSPRDLTLDRTPYQGWGGYSGLALRGPADWAGTVITIAGADPAPEVIGTPAAWCDLSGPDGGVTIVDHPANPRHPTPWYGNVRNPIYGDDLWTNFVNAAVLFHEPLSLPAGEALTFRYRIVTHDGPGDAAAAERWADEFAGTP